MSDLPPRLKDLLGGVGSRLGLEDARATGLLWARWVEVVGDTVAKNAEPTSLKRGVLRVRAASPGWAQELTYLAAEIRSRANALAGSEIVREVRVWTGPGKVTGATSGASPASQDGGHDRGPEDPPADLPEALERARQAWARRRGHKP